MQAAAFPDKVMATSHIMLHIQMPSVCGSCRVCLLCFFFVSTISTPHDYVCDVVLQGCRTTPLGSALLSAKAGKSAAAEQQPDVTSASWHALHLCWLLQTVNTSAPNPAQSQRQQAICISRFGITAPTQISRESMCHSLSWPSANFSTFP
jgi:hypothetical protein